MLRVKNGPAIATLSKKSLWANRSRNLVAIAAIALTTLLFTALFTISLSINAAFQDANFRQAGGWSHGGFKYLTEEQFNELKDDPLIEQWGVRRFLGMPEQAPFNKSHVEVGYSDATQAHWMYCDPIAGRLPQEGTDEAATDTRVLELLGVKPELGAQFTVTFNVDGHPTTQSFTLCGWWEYDEVIVANHILIPESRVNAVLDELGVDPATAISNNGSWNLDVMLADTWNIEQDLLDILANHGYQSESRSAGDNYIGIGVNWGYTGSQLTNSWDPYTAAAIVALLALIVFTGYLIIYNVFQISVVNDIRFYGMLKTIGATPRQLKRMIRRQALTLSLLGIPIGLALGWGGGCLLTPVIVRELNGVTIGVTSADPLIFIISALFALGTTLLSCARPGRLAARVSPIEALRYTEGNGRKHQHKRSVRPSLPRMALANLGRSRGKTLVTVLSLSLAVLLLTLTVTFTKGFDMDKYLSSKMCTDFVLADADYFQTTPGWDALPEDVITAVAEQGGLADGGRVYGGGGLIYETVTEEYFRTIWGHWISGDDLDLQVEYTDKTNDGLLVTDANLYGMEGFALDRLTLLEGDLSALYQPGSNAIAAVYTDDDYGNPEPDSHWARLGDQVTLQYVDEYAYVSPRSGEPVDPDSGEAYKLEVVRSHEVTYTVAALVVVPHSLSYRFYGSDQFVLNDQTFLRDSNNRGELMLYAFDATDSAADSALESFLADYTENHNPDCNFESKATYVQEFESFRSMFLLLGSALSFIVGLVGVLNFFNAVLTGILTRRREFAMLQAIGMTGRQLKIMLIWEGELYALGSIVFSLLLTLVAGPLLSFVLESMFWFYSYHLTVLPILILAPLFAALGVALPLASYRRIAQQTIVERLRQTE